MRRSTACSVSARWRQIHPATIAPGQQLRMPCFGLRQPAFGARQLLLHVSRRAADLLVRPLEQFGQRQFHMRR